MVCSEYPSMRKGETSMKKNMLLATLFFAAIAAVVAAAAANRDWDAEGQRWWAHVQYLADDRLEGRLTGSEGHRKAAGYVAGKFATAGLKPAGTDGYFQPVQFNVLQVDELNCSVELVRGGSSETVKLGEDADISMRSDPAENIEAQVVFAGYGFAVPEKNYDDLAGLDVRGKIVMYLAGGPASLPGPLKSHYQSAAERWKMLKNAGAIGVAVVENPRSRDIPWSRQALSRFQPAMSLTEPALQSSAGMRFALAINPDHADKFLAGSGHTFAEILAADAAQQPLPHFPLGASIRARIAVKRSQVESPNVVGVLPGTDPNLKNEYVALSAHLDHLGIGEPINGDNIYNGAMDDGSGIASLLEIARALHDSGAELKRSLIFVAVTAEEKGLLGSWYFANHPTVPAGSIVADINMDMFLPLHPLHYLEVQGVNESSLGDDIRAVCKAAGVEVQSDKEPNRNLFIRSDQYSFIKRGVPALAFKFGYLPGSKEEKLHKEWLTKNYHAPSDDANQPVDLAAAARFNDIIRKLTERVANSAGRPQWNKDSFFRRFAN
jgi:hypothetical protein